MKVSRRDNLDRYYLLQAFGFGLFLHKIHHDEDADTFHSHPWSWVSLIFGRYVEERLGEAKREHRWWNAVPAGVAHRVDLPLGPVWTLMLHGRRRCAWQVFDRSGAVLAVDPWRGVGGRTSYRPEENLVENEND